ncbi:MAG: 4-hydroxy-tetrahydrodipicolinate reductase [Actinomycetes bacterium]
MDGRGRRVVVFGGHGRLGSVLSAAVAAADDLELVARVGATDPRDELTRAGVQVAVDVTGPESVGANVAWCLQHGVHVVVGTSGMDASMLSRWESQLRAPAAPGHQPLEVLVVPNFSLGAVLMMRFAAAAARFFDTAEIIERHHAQKVDAPSGTARRTAAVIADEWSRSGRRVAGDGTRSGLDGARGARVEGVPVHSIRLPGLLAHHEVQFGGPGETLTVRHDSIDRSGFVPGALLAVRRVGEHPGLTVGLDQLLGV